MSSFNSNKLMYTVKRFFYFIFLFLFCFNYSFKAQNSKENGSYKIRNYSTKEYKAKAQNWAIIQDKRGVMYFGNNNDIEEYDGVKWRTIETNKNTTVRSMAIDSKGTIYVGAVGEIGYLAPDSSGQLKYRSLLNHLDKQDLDFADVWKTCITKNDEVYFQTSNKIFKWDGKKMKVWNATKSFHLMFQVSDKFYLREKEVGLLSLSDSNFVLVPNGESFANKAIYFMIPFDDNQTLLNIREKDAEGHVISDGLNLITHDNSKIIPLKTDIDNYFINNNIYNGISLDNSLFSIGTLGGGIVVIDSKGNLVSSVDVNSGLQDGTVFYQYVDQEKNLWLALNNGISRVSANSSITLFNDQNGLEGTIQDVIKYNNKIYVATNLGVFYLDNINETKNTSIEHPHFKQLKEIASECWGFLLFNNKTLLVTSNVGVYQISGDKVTKINSENATVLYRSKADSMRVFVGLAEGISTIYYKNGKWIEEGKINDVNEDIRSITEDRKGNVWLGTTVSGAIKINIKNGIKNTDVTKYNSQKSFLNIYTQVSKISDELFLGTTQGLFKFNEETNQIKPDSSFGSFFADSSRQIYRIAPDHIGNIWIVTTKVINKVPHIQIGYLKKEPDAKYSWIYNPFNLISKEITHAIYHDENGVTWLGGPDGLYRYDSKIKKNYTTPFNTLIRNVYIGNDSLVFAGTSFDEKGTVSLAQSELLKPKVKYRYNSFIFEFAATSYESEADNVYSYYLEGFDPQWSSWRNETKAVYTNLPEGNYSFKVKSKNIYGQESTEAVYQFTVLSPWYRTIWAYIVYILLSIGIVFGAVTVSTKSLKKIIDERTAEVVRQKNEIEVKNKDITDSINYAKKIQEAILPNTDIFKSLFKDGFILYKPKDIVSGDFYWLSEKENEVLIAAADCTGHGVPGAFMSMIGHALLNEIVNDKGITQPAKILDSLRSGIIKALKQSGKSGESKDGMDIALCNINREKGSLQYAGANNALFLIRNKELIEYKADKFPIGIGVNMESFSNNFIEIKKDDTIYIFSDGYADQFGGKDGKKFMRKRFKQMFLDINHLSMDEQKKEVGDSLTNWQGSYSQVDDVLVIGIKI